MPVPFIVGLVWVMKAIVIKFAFAILLFFAALTIPRPALALFRAISFSFREKMTHFDLVHGYLSQERHDARIAAIVDEKKEVKGHARTWSEAREVLMDMQKTLMLEALYALPKAWDSLKVTTIALWGKFVK